MKAAVVYSTLTGNIKKVVEAAIDVCQIVTDAEPMTACKVKMEAEAQAQVGK